MQQTKKADIFRTKTMAGYGLRTWRNILFGSLDGLSIHTSGPTAVSFLSLLQPVKMISSLSAFFFLCATSVCLINIHSVNTRN